MTIQKRYIMGLWPDPGRLLCQLVDHAPNLKILLTMKSLNTSKEVFFKV